MPIYIDAIQSLNVLIIIESIGSNQRIKVSNCRKKTHH